jgi:LAS superfamily LD-carboxypeptidase LdcB
MYSLSLLVCGVVVCVAAARDVLQSNGTAGAGSSCTLGQQAASASGCSTNVAEGLTYQIIGEMNSMGLSFKTLDSNWIKCASPCVNQLQASAADALANACVDANDYITLNSATRSSAQQYLLYEWYLKGNCGIGLAAKPGTSNHEGGRAIDT